VISVTDIHRLAAEIGAVLLLFAVLGTGLAMIAASSADAQELPDGSQSGGGNVTDSEAQDAPCDRIDEETRICGSDYDEDRGVAWVVIESDRPQTVVVSDAGSFMAGGQVPQTRVRVSPNERVNISVPYQRYEGVLALSVSTRGTLWAEIVDKDNLIDQPTKDDGLALLSGVGVMLTSLVGLNRLASWYWSWGVRRIDG
jgi:hypothetical protein